MVLSTSREVKSKLKVAEVEEGIVVGNCRGGCKNKEGGEKAPTIL